jgi:hypothetical protein
MRMNDIPNPAQFQSSKGSLPVPYVDWADLKNDQFPSGRPSLQRRSQRALTRFLITFCIGVAATLAWQSYGDAARDIIASSYPQLSWSAPRPAPTAQNASDVIAPTASAAASPDQPQLSAMSLDVDAVRQSLDEIGASQEEMARSINRLTTGQEQMTHEITKLQEIAQYALYKNSEPSVQPATPPGRKPVPRPSQGPPVLTPARSP